MGLLLPICDVAIGSDCVGIEWEPFEQLIGAVAPWDHQIEKEGGAD